MRVIWEIQGDQLAATDASGRTLWRGRPLDGVPRSVLALEGSNDCIVLLRYEDAPAGPNTNLLRLAPTGEIVWRAGLPSDEANDTYVSVSRTADGVVANSWSGYWVRVDESSGMILERVFTK